MNTSTTPIALPFRLLGYAGLIPFAAGAALAVLGPPSWRAWAVTALAAYGAVILSFLGAVHWGLALRARPEEGGAVWPRLGLGVVPALVGWVSLLLPARPGLLLLALGVLAVAAVETTAARRGTVPRDYLELRWWLSLGAGGSLLLGVWGRLRLATRSAERRHRTGAGVTGKVVPFVPVSRHSAENQHVSAA